MQHYHATFRVLPCSSLEPEWISASGEWSWGAMISPFLEQESVKSQCDFNLWPAEKENRFALQNPLPLFRCPSEAIARYTNCKVWDGYDWAEVQLPNDNYGLNEQLDVLGANGSWRWRFADVIDGSSNTIMLGETTPLDDWTKSAVKSHWRITWSCTITAGADKSNQYDFWTSVDCTGITHPSEQEWDHLSSHHAGGVHVAMCDGSVHMLGRTTDTETLGRLAHPRDRKPVSGW